MLRLDVCHFMNMVARWKCWKNVLRGVRQMYLRCFAILRKQSDFKGLEKHARAIFILALNSNLSSGNSTDQARVLLTTSIQGLPMEENYEYDESDDIMSASDDADNTDDLESGMQHTDIFKWVSDQHK